MLLQGKKGVVVGVANKRSIAWAIAESLRRDGAQLAFTYQNERLLGKIKQLLEADMPEASLYECDVSDDQQIGNVFSKIGADFQQIDFLVHSVAFANKEDLNGGFVNTSREGFKLACDVSAYSLIALAKAVAPYMKDGGSIMALTYLGSSKVIPGYDVMGVAKAALESSLRYLANDLGPRNIRVNGISAGPINTLAARGIANFTHMLKIAADKAPLKRNTEASEVGDTALYLASHLSRGVTGEIIHVDNGIHCMG